MFVSVLDRPALTAVDDFADLQALSAGLSDDEALQELREIEGRRRADAAREAALLQRLGDAKVYKADGHASMRGLLRSALHWSEAECIERMQLARLCERFPDDIANTLLHAQASVANIATIARAAANQRIGDRIDDVIGAFARQAERREHPDLRLVVRTWEKREDRDHEARKAATAHERRTAQWHLDPDSGTAHVAANFAGLDALEVIEILAMYEQAEWDTDWAWVKERYGDDTSVALLPRTAEQRRADAMANALRDGASRPPGSKAPEPVANIHVDYHTFHDILTEAGILPEHDADPFDNFPADPNGQSVHVTNLFCHTTNGHHVDPHTMLRILLENHIRWVIRNDQGIPIHWGRTRRLFKGAARDAVRCLSTRCTHPGCRVPTTKCETDHTTEHSHGGRTDPDNGNPRCQHHNLGRHNRRFTVWRDQLGEWHTYRPDGTEIQ